MNGAWAKFLRHEERIGMSLLYSRDIVARHRLVTVQHIACNEEFSVRTPGVHEPLAHRRLCGRPWLEIIVDEAIFSPLTPIDVVAHPVIDDIVAEVDEFAGSIWRRSRATESWQPARMASEQIVMECSLLAAPDTTIAVISLGMGRVIQTFGDDTPLEGEVFIIIE